MSRPSETAQLKQVPRFANLSNRELKAVAEAGTFVHLPANWALMSETTPADKAYVILSGEVAIRHHGQTVATVGAGDIIGEVGVLEKRLRTASVVSITELQVVHFTNEDLNPAGRPDPRPGRGSARHRPGAQGRGRGILRGLTVYSGWLLGPARVAPGGAVARSRWSSSERQRAYREPYREPSIFVTAL